MMEFNGMGLSEITKENQIRQCVQKSCPEAGWYSGVREGQGDPQEPAKEPEKGQGAQEGRRPSEEKVSAVLGGWRHKTIRNWQEGRGYIKSTWQRAWHMGGVHLC